MIKNMEARSKLEALVNKWTAPPQSENLIVEDEYEYELKVVRTTSKNRVSLLYGKDYVCACFDWEVDEAKDDFCNWMSSGRYSFDEVKIRMKEKYNIKKIGKGKGKKTKKSVKSKDDLRERVSFLESTNKELLLKVDSLEMENEELKKSNDTLAVKVIDFEKERYDYDEKITSFLKGRWGYNDTYSYDHDEHYFKTKRGRRPFYIRWEESLNIVKMSKKGMKPSSIFRKIEFSSGKVKEETVFNFIERYYSGRMYYAFQSIYNRYSEIPEKDKENYLNPTKRWE